MLYRLPHRSVVLNLDGDSYRLSDHHARKNTLRTTLTGTRQPLTPPHEWGNSMSTTGAFR